MECGIDFADKKVNIEDETERNYDAERLHNALSKLRPQQHLLIKRVYWNGEKMSDIAAEEGVGDSSVRHRMQRALNMLKKYLE